MTSNMITGANLGKFKNYFKQQYDNMSHYNGNYPDNMSQMGVIGPGAIGLNETADARAGLRSNREELRP